MSPSSTSRRRRRSRSGSPLRSEGAAGGAEQRQQRHLRSMMMTRRTERMLALAAGLSLAAGRGGVSSQFTDGGAVDLSCGLCDCTGSSDGVSFVVFDNPSSGERIVSVDGDYSEILDTSCGTSAVAVGSTVYELSGVGDLDSRGLEVLDMTPSSTCVTADTPDTADCYSAPTTTVTLTDDVYVELTFNIGIWTDDGSTFYKSFTNTKVFGTTVVEYEFESFCYENEFLSQVFLVTVLDTTYKYNFEFALPGDPTSSDLSVSGAASSSAEAFICGEDLPAPTPSPVTPSTPAPVTPPTEPATEPPTEPLTAPATPAPATPAPTTAVSAAATPGPVAAVTPTSAPQAAAAATAAPVLASPAPVAPVVNTATAAPTLPAVGNVTTETPVGGGGDDLATTPSPTVVVFVNNTQAPSFDYEDEDACILPESKPCTEATSFSNTNEGIGDYYEPACELVEGEEQLGGCNADASSLCRMCFFNTPLYVEKHPDDDLPDYPDCPCCVLDIYEQDAFNLDGQRCVSVSPAPSAPALTEIPVGEITPRGFDDLSFDDGGWEMNAGEVAALSALGLLAALTFFPFCSK